MNTLAKSPHWLDLAEQRAEVSQNPKIYIGAGLAGALLAGTLLNPLTAVLAALWGLYMAWEANEAVSDHMEAVEDGIIAHLLDKKQLRQYLAEFGKEQVQMELQVAIARELPLSDAATEAAKRLELDTSGKTVDRLPGLPPAKPKKGEQVGPITRLTAVSTSAEEVPDTDLPEPEQESGLALLREALHYPAVLIFGASGAGKSTLARWFVYERLSLGHAVEILDPHVAYGQWEGLPVYGAGLDYSSCDARLGNFADLVQSRYQSLASSPDFSPRAFTVLLEEFTNWASHCPRSGDFFSSSMSDLRKVNMHALYVSHGKTLASLGGSSGTAKQRDASLMMIELDAKVGPDGRPCPAGTGRIYYPGQHGSPVEITIPHLEAKPEFKEPESVPENRAEPELEKAWLTENSDELIADIREKLIKAEHPLKASEIRQKISKLKRDKGLQETALLLNRMAMEGFIKRSDETPPRYTV
jgi:hypothetical protein